MSWLLNSLSQEQELEQFLAGIPGFYKSTRVEDPAQVLRKSNTDRFPRAIVSFIDRSLSSDLISDSTRQQRIRVSLKAIQTDPYLLQRTFHHALCSEDSAIFKCIEFVLMAERYTDDEDPNVQFLARCIVAVAITRIADHDLNERWSGIVRRRLNLSGSDLTAFGKQRDNLLLRNLVQLVRELNTAHPDYDEPGARVILDKTLNAVRQMKILRRTWNGMLSSDRMRCVSFPSSVPSISPCTKAPIPDSLLIQPSQMTPSPPFRGRFHTLCVPSLPMRPRIVRLRAGVFLVPMTPEGPRQILAREIYPGLQEVLLATEGKDHLRLGDLLHLLSSPPHSRVTHPHLVLPPYVFTKTQDGRHLGRDFETFYWDVEVFFSLATRRPRPES
ncbi:hypothetical protein B0F90DRAFT_631560 [Multifurca ochricompacta]|uniref:Uncharacterized protein n=1 Tax=Multifurca ochricompacta TaxID=376703 RepID=A0AAD4M4A6_9AGAM|nr:hypothetical protein B0F90DRAFT_631560 [Multifurca ochricompacta]